MRKLAVTPKKLREAGEKLVKKHGIEVSKPFIPFVSYRVSHAFPIAFKEHGLPFHGMAMVGERAPEFVRFHEIREAMTKKMPFVRIDYPERVMGRVKRLVERLPLGEAPRGFIELIEAAAKQRTTVPIRFGSHATPRVPIEDWNIIRTLPEKYRKELGVFPGIRKREVAALAQMAGFSKREAKRLVKMRRLPKAVKKKILRGVEEEVKRIQTLPPRAAKREVQKLITKPTIYEQMRLTGGEAAHVGRRLGGFAARMALEAIRKRLKL